jgi:hypothetical protein
MRIPKPEYKIGDVVYYRGFLGFVQQGIVIAATFFEVDFDDDYRDGKWRYYVKSRPNSWMVRHKEIISKA